METINAAMKRAQRILASNTEQTLLDRFTHQQKTEIIAAGMTAQQHMQDQEDFGVALITSAALAIELGRERSGTVRES